MNDDDTHHDLTLNDCIQAFGLLHHQASVQVFLTVLIFLIKIVLTVLIFLTEIVLTVLIFPTEIVLTLLIFPTEIVLTLLIFSTADRISQQLPCGACALVRFVRHLHVGGWGSAPHAARACV